MNPAPHESFSLKPRTELGFSDADLEGYMVIRDGRYLIQLHIYEEYYTLFWRWTTRCAPLRLKEILRDCTHEIAERLKMEAQDLNSGPAQYKLGSQLHRKTFVVQRYRPDQEQAHQENLDFLVDNADAITFLRFDVQHAVPIILWASLRNSPHAEIGFSSIVLPGAILRLFQETLTGIDEDDIPEIRRLLEEKLTPFTSKQEAIIRGHATAETAVQSRGSR